MAGKCHHPRGRTEKYYFVICFSVDTSTPELASMESTCFASVTGVAFAECKRALPRPRATPPLLYNFLEIVHVTHRRQDCLRRPADISRVFDDGRRGVADAPLFVALPRISSRSRRADKCDGRRLTTTYVSVEVRENKKKGRRGRERGVEISTNGEIDFACNKITF